MNKLDLFKNKENSSNPIPYEKFKAVGWDFEVYIEYLKIVEEYRAYVIISEIQQSRKTKVSKTFKRDNEPLNKLIMFLNRKFGCNMNKLKDYGVFFHIIRYGIGAGEYVGRLNDLDKQVKVCLNNTYLSSEDFRNKIENYIKDMLFPKEIIDMQTVSTEKLQEYLKEIQLEYQKNNQCPYIPDEMESDEALYLWSKGMEKALNNDLLYDDICSIEDEIERRSNSKNYNASENILYIHIGNNIKCYVQNHEVISATAILKGKLAVDIKLNVNYCRNCDKYLINYSEFSYYRELYGIIIGNFKIDTEENILHTGNVVRVSESPLMLSGYNVRDGCLTDSERKYILSEIIKNKIMLKSEIINYLKSFILINGKRKGNEQATKKWEDDLTFVRNYGMEDQEKVLISEIKKY